MKTIWKRFACLAVALITPAALTGCQQNTPAQGLCYRISGGRNPMVILGSIHVGGPVMEPYGQHITDAMEQADAFVFECDTDDPAAAAASASMMLLEDGTLQDHLSHETWELLEQACAKAGLPPEGLKGLKPWAVTSMLTTRAAAGQMGARNARQAVERGVEEEVQDHVAGREVLYLETAVSQLQALDGFSPALQEELLRQACEAILSPEETTTLAQWPQWWHDGDAASFVKEYQKDEGLPRNLVEEYHQSLVTGRNRHMADGLAQLLEDDTGRSYFVTVGLMHLVLPEDSVLWELEQRGYTVERMMLETSEDEEP